MEQVIKFRGKSIDNNDFVYGYYHQDPEDGHFITDFEYVNVPAGFDEPPSGFFKKVSLEVTPESVGQFTGLLDKHGKEIYCGDKLQKIYEDKCEEGGFGKTIVDVAFKDGAFGWIGEITGNFHPFAVEPFEDSEIIGNIHQNSK